MLFDTLSPIAPRLSKLMTNDIVKWGIRDAREMEHWEVGLRFVEQASAIAGYESIPFRPQRLLFRLANTILGRNYDVVSRFEF